MSSKNSANTKEYKIKNTVIQIDSEFESSIGIYGDQFWTSVSSGDYESSTFEFLENLKQSGYEYFLDIGAATGCMTLYAASTGLKVIAVEPQKTVFDALERNVLLNPHLATQISLEFALVTPTGTLSGISDSFTPGAAGPIASGELTTDAVSIETLLKRIPADSKVAIKIDIEGAEFPIFANRQVLRKLAQHQILIYIALHPGFKKPLKIDADLLTHTLWRVQAIHDTMRFYFGLKNLANLSSAKSLKKINLFGLLRNLARDEKDFLITFN